MKSGRCVLKECYTPFILLLHSNECLNCIDLGVNICLSWRYHAGDGAQNSNIWRQKAHFFNDSQICGSLVIGKDLAKNRSSLRPSINLTPVESDKVTVLSKQIGHFTSSALVPPF